MLSPDRFAMLLVDEPRALLQDFLERFQSLCQLELQLPSLRPEDMKNMVSSHLPYSECIQVPSEGARHSCAVQTQTETVERLKLETCMCEWSAITMAFSLCIPTMMVSPGISGSMEKGAWKGSFSVTSAGTMCSRHHNGRWAVVSGSHSAPFPVCVVLFGAWQKWFGIPQAP